MKIQTTLFEVGNISNKCPKDDRTYKVLTPNCLLLGRSKSKVPDDAKLAKNLKQSERYKVIQQVTKNFWEGAKAELLKKSERCKLIQQVKKNFCDRWSIKVAPQDNPLPKVA